jgi:flagellar assembly factor FliW
MDVQTTRFGTIAVAEEQQVYFPEGLLGFSAFREFVLIPANGGSTGCLDDPAKGTGQGGPIVWLQSRQTPELAFALCPAEVLLADHRIEARADDLAGIELASPDGAAVYFIVYRDREGLIANLRGPILINRDRRLGKQYVINDRHVPLRHRVPLRRPAREPVLQEATRRAV